MATTEVNLILQADAYKYSHYKQYPKGSEFVTSYIEPRGFAAPFKNNPEVVFAGIEPILQLLKKPITLVDVMKAKRIVTAMGLPFNEEDFNRIVTEHDGFLPIEIEALPEGTVVKTKIPLVQVTNTDPTMPWLPSFIETLLLRAIWYPTTVATLSRETKKVIKQYLELTADDISGLPFKLHDFGARGATSHESAALGGYGHLINFLGTDTVEAVELIYDMFDGHITNTVAGFSIPAAEHSTITTWPTEHAAYKNMLDQFGTGLVAVVSDSYDIFKACDEIWGVDLKDQIINMGGTLVVRPDSGDPVEMTLKVIEILGNRFGWTVNTKGFKVLPKYIRMIQGDGVNLESIDRILANFMLHGWSADNIAFGMGGALLQRLDRDSLKFAMKANEIIIDGVQHDVFKNPVTDPGKASKKGKQLVIRQKDGSIFAVAEKTYGNYAFGEKLLQQRYKNGAVFNTPTFDEIRARAEL